MKSIVPAVVERLTSDKKLPVIEALRARREELYKSLVSMRDQQEVTRLQGRAEEIEFLLSAFEK